MSMMRKLFRPGAGSVPQRFQAAFVNATTSYRGDVAVWDTTAPTSQGSSGELEGKTLGANDFIYVTIAPATATNCYCRVAGIYEGVTIGDTNTTDNFGDDTVVIVQTWGVHSKTRTVATVVAGSILTTGAVAGECAEVLTTDVATDVAIYNVIGVALTTDATYTRAAGTENAVTAFIRADW